MTEQFHNWIVPTSAYPVLLVRYEKLWDHLPELAEFLGIPVGEMKDFPPYHKRETSWLNEPEDIRNRLFRIYGGLAEEINNFDDIKLVTYIKAGTINGGRSL